jgi:hypothetical protein
MGSVSVAVSDPLAGRAKPGPSSFQTPPTGLCLQALARGHLCVRERGGGERGQGGSTAAGGAAEVVCSATASADTTISRSSVGGGSTARFFLGERHCLNPNRALGALVGGRVANPALARFSLSPFGAAAALSAATASAATSSYRVVDTIF